MSGSPAPTSGETAAVDPGAFEVAAPVTLSGIWADLVITAPERGARPLWKYGLGLLGAAVLSSSFHLMVIYRVGAFSQKLRLRPVAIVCEKLIQHLYFCFIPCRARIGPGLWLPHPVGIVFHPRTRIGQGVAVFQHAQVVTPGNEPWAGVIADGATLGTTCVVLGRGCVGQGSTIGAHAVVTKPVPARQAAMGAPATWRPLREGEGRTNYRLSERTRYLGGLPPAPR